jgi:hypothetical protein
MGLDRNLKTPCGFCFVECALFLFFLLCVLAYPLSSNRFFHHEHAVASLRCISGTKLDERIIRADLDPGYLENRQYGRGKSGGQVRDEYREDWDGASTLSSPLFPPKVSTNRMLNFLDDLQLDEEVGVTSRVGKKWRRTGSASRTRSTGRITTRLVLVARFRAEKEWPTRYVSFLNLSLLNARSRAPTV